MHLEEALHILVSVVTISIAFTILYTGSFDITSNFAFNFAQILFTVGLGFIIHELAHRYVAIKYGAKARYRAWTLGLVFAILTSFVGFVFAAPGAVYVYGKTLTREQNGKVSLAGPFSNLLLAILFLVIGLLAPGLREVSSLGVQVNAFLGLFNLIPFHPLDGGKIYEYSKTKWALTAAALLVMLLISPLAFG
ncbi:site-2 protease family protein [Candidatus Micrarchaeota archaeon]|nr:site-2 protease family protein [Candidatus Micrarchaeota archaeon]